MVILVINDVISELELLIGLLMIDGGNQLCLAFYVYHSIAYVLKIQNLGPAKLTLAFCRIPSINSILTIIAETITKD